LMLCRVGAVVGLVGLIVGSLVIMTAKSRPAGAIASSFENYRLYVQNVNGDVVGTLEPNSAYVVSLMRGGTLKATAEGTTDAAGSYSTRVAWHDGIFPGIHNGDTVRVSSGGKTYTQEVNLVGTLDEKTGVLTGSTVPGASLTADLYTHGDHANHLGIVDVPVAADGTFRVDMGRALGHVPAPVQGRPPWRGYQAELESQDVEHQAVWRSVQTPNLDLVTTQNLASVSSLLPGGRAEFAVVREGAVVATAVGTVGDDGIAQTEMPPGFTAREGDRLQTSYQDAARPEPQMMVLLPLRLTVLADNASNAVSGMTTPGAPLAVDSYGPAEATQLRTTADGGGRYVVTFPDLVGGLGIRVTSIADPGFTGVGMYQIAMHTQIVRLDVLANTVTGYGAPGASSVTAEILRDGSSWGVSTGTINRIGKFSVPLGLEAQPGDVVRVVTGSLRLPDFAVGSGEFRAHRDGKGAIVGTGTAGRAVSVVVATARGHCPLTATVDASGSWSAPDRCSQSGVEFIQATETVVGPANLAGAGSLRGVFVFGTAPEVLVTAPQRLRVARRGVAITATAWDHDDNRAPSRVEYTVMHPSGRVVSRGLLSNEPAAPQVFSRRLRLPHGTYRLRVVACDAESRVDSTRGETICRATRVRTFRVR
jgi:hypothetical protein